RGDAREDGATRHERGGARVRRRARGTRRRAPRGRPVEQRRVQDVDLAHQPRTVRQRGDVPGCRARRVRVRGALRERADDRRAAAREAAGTAVEARGHGDAARERAPAAATRGAPRRTARYSAGARDRDGEVRREPRREVRVRRGDPAPRRLRVSREYPVERAYRDIRGLCIGAGTVEIQRNFIGSNVVKGATTVSAGWRNPLVG